MSTWWATLRAVSIGAILALTVLAGLLPERARAADKKIDLQFFVLNRDLQNPEQKNWTAADAQEMLNDANDIWNVAGIEFNSNLSLTFIDDPQPNEGKMGDVKVPKLADPSLKEDQPSPYRLFPPDLDEYGDAWAHLLPYPGLIEKADRKEPREVKRICDSARTDENAKPKAVPVVLIQEFILPKNGTLAPILGLAIRNPGQRGDLQLRPAPCILIDEDAQGDPTTLAHELGHAMCLPHEAALDNLMLPGDDGNGVPNDQLQNEQTRQKGGQPPGLLCPKELRKKLNHLGAAPPGGRNVAGNYRILVTVIPVQRCKNGQPEPSCIGQPDGTIVPGFYYDCLTDIEQVSKNLTARMYCYIDSPGVTVNPQWANEEACPPADPAFCGDGMPGAAPPGASVSPPCPASPTPPNRADCQVLFGDVDGAHSVLTGVVDNSDDTVTLEGCEDNADGPLGTLYWRVVAQGRTLQGTVRIWLIPPPAQCPLSPLTDPPTLVAPAKLFWLGNPADEHDEDEDGCPDKQELTDAPGQGGLRDPMNHYDYMNAEKDGQNRVSDILVVVGQYFQDDVGSPDLKSQTDRTALLGGNAWNLGPPNGQQRVDDILAQVKQYFHDC